MSTSLPLIDTTWRKYNKLQATCIVFGYIRQSQSLLPSYSPYFYIQPCIADICLKYFWIQYFKAKVIFIGDRKVGKTRIIQRYAFKIFPDEQKYTTLPVDFALKRVRCGDHLLKSIIIIII